MEAIRAIDPSLAVAAPGDPEAWSVQLFRSIDSGGGLCAVCCVCVCCACCVLRVFVFLCFQTSPHHTLKQQHQHPKKTRPRASRRAPRAATRRGSTSARASASTRRFTARTCRPCATRSAFCTSRTRCVQWGGCFVMSFHCVFWKQGVIWGKEAVCVMTAGAALSARAT